jgi:SAM-dependent methyltransferase
VVGVEGRIESDEHDEERFRIVQNLEVNGIGFKTANLFLRKNTVEKIGGFDERFDNPHFREDTDLAWRALADGEIPFADDVRILHPAHPRDIQRESGEERANFFVHDPLLFHKHPERYVRLLKAEKHYARTPGFWEHFMRGMVRYKVEIPVEDLRQYTTADQYALLGELVKQLCSWPLDAAAPIEAAVSTKANRLILPESTAKDAIPEPILDTTVIDNGAPTNGREHTDPQVSVRGQSVAIIRNAWEVETDEHMLLALTGHVSREEYLQNRKERAVEVLDLCRIGPAQRGFEIGSGDGTVAKILSPHCHSLDCTDISSSFLAAARRNCAQCRNLSFHQIGSDYLAFLPSNAYDFGFALHVFIHLNAYDIFHYLRDVRRLLRKGGSFLFDACDLGVQMLDGFREHAQIYRSDPARVRGLLNFNSAVALKTLIEEVGFSAPNLSILGESGWIRVLVTK